MGTYAGISVLVLEDDNMCRALTRNVLLAAGFKVMCARDVGEALRFIGSGAKIDLAVVDVKMPRGQPHGIAFARMAQLQHPGMKVVLMSASVMPGEFSLVDENDMFLRKPFAPDHLLEMVTRAAA